VQKLEDVLTVVAPGFVEDYVTGGRDMPTKQVTLRQVTSGSYRIFGDEASGWIRSEALIRLDLGEGACPAFWSWAPRTRISSARRKAPTF
jgi:hypothetical protein